MECEGKDSALGKRVTVATFGEVLPPYPWWVWQTNTSSGPLKGGSAVKRRGWDYDIKNGTRRGIRRGLLKV